MPSGSGISYGHRFVTSRPSRLAVIGIGYADGVVRPQRQDRGLHRGRRLPQVGNITMDQIILDATGIEDLTVGDTITLLGQDGADCINPQDWSVRCGSIPGNSLWFQTPPATDRDLTDRPTLGILLRPLERWLSG